MDTGREQDQQEGHTAWQEAGALRTAGTGLSSVTGGDRGTISRERPSGDREPFRKEGKVISEMADAGGREEGHSYCVFRLLRGTVFIISLITASTRFV